VSTPSSPTEVGFYDTPNFATGVAVSGGYAYVANSHAGLFVIDVSTPSAPSEVGFYDTPGHAHGVAVSGGYAYVADFFEGLRVIDVSTPSSPTEVGFYDTPGYASGVAVSGGYAYVADYYEGLRVIDVSTPSTPTEVGSYYTPGIAKGVEVSDGYAFIADDYAGVEVFRMCPLSLSVGVQGSGTGTITSTPVGIDCGAVCRAMFDVGTAVTLAVVVDSGAVFDGWVSSDCTGYGDCALTMTENKSVVALLNLEGACGLGDALALEQMSIDWTHEFEACTSITAGNDFQVLSTGNVTFRAGESVFLENGFSVATGGAFTVEIDPGVGPPP
jgi:hypothetical protein